MLRLSKPEQEPTFGARSRISAIQSTSGKTKGGGGPHSKMRE